MLILYSTIFNTKILKKICKINKIKNYCKLKKDELLNTINEYKSVCYIQKFIRNRFMVSELCPITLDSLEYPFVSLKNNKIFRYYSLEGIVNYYNSSKDYRDPFTKEVICDKKIKEINNLAKFYKKKQIVTQKRNMNIQRRTELLTILCCLNDIVNNIMSTVILSDEYIYNYAITHIMTYVYYLFLRCRTQARTIIQHFIDIIQGHPDENKYKITDYILAIIIE